MEFDVRPHEKRKAVRRILADLEKHRNRIERCLARSQPLPEDTLKYCAFLNVTDPTGLLVAVTQFHEQYQAAYFNELRNLARNDLTAYAEYINPDEPPAPHHVWMCDKLQLMESREVLRMLISMPPGHAKALALDTPIPTPTGFTTIDALKPGDQVFGPDGMVTHVTAKSQVFNGRRTFRAFTDDGQEVICDADHLWTVRLDRKRKVYRTFTTLELFERQSKMTDFRPPRLPDVLPVRYPTKDLPLDAYTLGLWLGDGHADSGAITASLDDQEETRHRIEQGGIETKSRKKGITFSVLDIRKQLVTLDVLNNKHIPDSYLFADVDDRLALLQGLMDSDGTVSPTGQCTFANTNKRLIDGVQHLLFSFGVKNSIIESRAVCNGKDCGPYWRVSFYFKDAFYLSRKAGRAAKHQARVGRYIRFEEIDSRPTQCITVAREDGLFLAGRGMIVTHNSTYSSRLYPSWYMGRNVKHKYIQAGHTTSFCESEFGKKTKAIIDSERFRDVFPDIYLAVDSKAAGNWSLAGTGGQYLTRGVGQGISGFRAHMAGVDDPFASREDAESQTIRDKVYDWFSADFTTRLLPNSPMFVVATRWHSDDLCGRIEDMNRQGRGLPWEVINLPAICEDPEIDPMGRAEGEPLWPDFYTHDHLMNLKATLPPRDWNSLYMGKPVDEEGGVIIAEWLKTYDMLPGHNSRKRTVVSVDSAIKATERADFTAIGVWVEDYDGFHHLAYVHRARVEFPQMVSLVENIATVWNADVILIEDKGSGTQYIQTRANKAPCPVVPLSPNNNSKEFRLDGVAPLFQAGKVLLPTRSEWLPDYVAELLGFPNAKYDDQVDFTSQYLAWARQSIKRGNVKLQGKALGGRDKSSTLSEIERQLEEISKKARQDPLAQALAAAQIS